MKTQKLLVFVASVCLMAFFNVLSFAQEENSQCLTIIGELVDIVSNQQDTIDQCEAQLAECEGMQENFAPVPRTGVYHSTNVGDDGWTRRGVTWPEPRFTDNGDGTVTDNLTGLIWLKNATCLPAQLWAEAFSTVDALADGQCGLSDGSEPGDWSVPNLREFESLIDFERWRPAIPLINPFFPFSDRNQWEVVFGDEQPVLYTTANSKPSDDDFPHEDWDVGVARVVDIISGDRELVPKPDTLLYVWPIRIR